MSNGSVSVAKVAQVLNLKNFTPDINLKKCKIISSDVNRPALQLTGYFEHFEESRIQMIGNVEYTFIQQMSDAEKKTRYDAFLKFDIPCVIFCRSLQPDEIFLEEAIKNEVPVLGTDRPTSEFMAELIYTLGEELAPCITVHGVLVDVYGEGLMITGDSGIGKSEAALELIRRGHRLVTDDVVEIRKINEHTLIGTSPEVTRHFIELRGIGIIDVKTLYGVECVKEKQQIDLVIKLEDWKKDADYDRLGLEEEYIEYLGNKVVCHSLPIRPGRNLAVICETAAVNHRQKKMGYNAAQELYRRVQAKGLALFVIGEKDIEEGMNILGAHIDSPRMDLKQVPLYEDTEMALLDTHYYGGVKKYQWVTLPLALHGVICKKDGTTVTVNIGEKPEDPVFGVSDLLIHLAGEQMEKKASKVIEGENLDLLVGSIPAASDDEKEKKEMKDRVKANILNILSKEYGVDEEDFLSAEIEVVPAGAARDYGFDRSMIMGYGHDDRVCAYPSFAAMLEIEKPQHTSVCLLVDKEEIGSVGASGMQSHFFEDSVAEIINLLGEYSELKVRRALHNSRVLSSDVSAAFDPNYPSVMEKRNCAYFGKGLVLNKYTGARGKSGSNDANAEYIARLRRIFDDNDVSFQTSELGKVDQGGGGTIAYILANYGMNVIDSGVAVLNMHAPWEIISKVDLYEALHGYVAFLKEA